jgi:NADPH:quinone reductase-like Zn-dependent oxidoreductase
VIKTTICGTDLHIMKGDLPEVIDGRILGHEGVGIIEEVGSAVSNFKKGDHVIISCVCGLVLGIIGSVWSKRLPFGAVIGGALTCSMLTAGLMGTMIPVLSKRLGFDPATTAGPFETAFQDVVGFAVFLWLATLLQQWIS